MRFIKILFVISSIVLLFCICVQAQEEPQIYSKAVQSAAAGDRDFAFMYFNSLLVNFPESKYNESALFATGEYYFMAADYYDALGAFNKFTANYPDSKNKVFALAYLLKIAEKEGQDALKKSLENKIVTLNQVSLLFRNFKEYKYKSPLCRKHKVIYYVDRVEFYIDGELFAKIPY